MPETWIRQVRWTSNLERWEVGFEAVLAGNLGRHLRLHVKLLVKDVLIADDTYAVVAGEVHRRIALSDPGIDDYRNDRIDSITSYTALRSAAVQRDRFLLNGRPYYMRLVLDQGYWPDTGLTAPDDAALRIDVETAKRMGFNGVRKHQKRR